MAAARTPNRVSLCSHFGPQATECHAQCSAICVVQTMQSSGFAMMPCVMLCYDIPSPPPHPRLPSPPDPLPLR
eukprot:8949814-Pyramimonas_sp.AAC.1